MDVLLIKGINVATLNLALSFSKFLMFYEEAKISFLVKYVNLVVADLIIVYEEDKDFIIYKNLEDYLYLIYIKFNIRSRRILIPNLVSIEVKNINYKAKLLYFHCKFGHVSF